MDALSFSEVWGRICEATGWSKYGELAVFLGIQPPSISGAKSRGVFPTEWAIDVARAHNLDIGHILFNVSSSQRGPAVCTPTSNLDPGEYSLVPRYNVEVSAGHGCWPECEEVIEKMAFRRSWLQRLGLQVKSLVLVTARGDSMEPTFYDGDLLLVDLGQVKVIDGGISVIRNDGLLLAKRLQAGLGEQVYVCSDNQRYQRLEIIKENLNIVGRVVWRGGKM